MLTYAIGVFCILPNNSFRSFIHSKREIVMGGGGGRYRDFDVFMFSATWLRKMVYGMPPVCLSVCLYVCMPTSTYVCVCYRLNLRKAAPAQTTVNTSLSLCQSSLGQRLHMHAASATASTSACVRQRLHLRLRLRLCLWLRLRQRLRVSHRLGLHLCHLLRLCEWLRLRKGAIHLHLVHTNFTLRKYESLLKARIWPPGLVHGYLENNVKPSSVGITKNFWMLKQAIRTITTAM
jgi:hypothetical protein